LLFFVERWLDLLYFDLRVSHGDCFT
jgi:hypothetical protein